MSSHSVSSMSEFGSPPLGGRAGDLVGMDGISGRNCFRLSTFYFFKKGPDSIPFPPELFVSRLEVDSCFRPRSQFRQHRS